MDSSTLSAFRRDLYGCFLKSSDALMNAVDALLTDCTATSFVELSLSPRYRRFPAVGRTLWITNA